MNKHAVKFAETSDVLGALVAKLETLGYSESVTREEYNRDLAIALEQGQKIVDEFTDIIEEIDSDNSHYKAWAKEYIKAHGGA